LKKDSYDEGIISIIPLPQMK